MSDKIAIPQVLEAFRAYHEKNLTWGSLHVVLDDGNVSDAHVEFCATYAAERGDAEGARLAEVLLSMSRTQRLRLRDIA